MALFPTSFGTRPRLAVEVRPEGVVAARADEGSSLLAAVSHVELGQGASVPQLRAGSATTGHSTAEPSHNPLPPADRAVLIAAVRSSLESVAGRSRDTTVVLPDAAVRVLLLDFDALPARPAEALPIVRFRLKKLVPFETDTAAVSYQIMSSTRGNVRVLAVAIPGDLLAEYENVVREAGFEPGAVLPSTLATLAALPDRDEPLLVVNASRHSVTTAIAHGNLLLLHRSLDLGGPPDRAGVSPSAQIAEITEAAAGVQTPELERDLGPIELQDNAAWELAQAVSVAAAYFEDTLQTPPGALLASGTLPASTLSKMLTCANVWPVAIADVVDRTMLSAEAGIGSRVPMAWLAGVRGALAS